MMKKLLLILIGLFVVTLAASQEYNSPILRDGYKIHFLPDNWKMVPISYNGKFGFARNSTSPTIIIEPTFDGIQNTWCGLIPVKKNGRWGAVEATLNHSHAGDQPIIPCDYELIEPKDDEHVIATIDGKKRTLNIKDFIRHD